MQRMMHTPHRLPMYGKRLRLAGRRLAAGLLLATACACGAAVAASLTFDENRYMIQQGSAKVPVMIGNRGNEPALVQVSLDWAQAGRDDDVPLAVSRPLRQIPAGDAAVVEVYYQGVGLPQDRESAFLLNVLDVPRIQESSSEVQVRIAARHRLKLFYRPDLPVPPSAARDALRWRLPTGGPAGAVQVENTSPYFVTMVDIMAEDSAGAVCGSPVAHMMVAPYATATQTISGCTGTVARLHYRYVTDSGRELPYAVSLQDGVARVALQTQGKEKTA